PSVSAGSSQRDASVMCRPHVIVPSGAAAPGAARPLETTTPEPASAADIFRISRRLRSPTQELAILFPFLRQAAKAGRRPDILDADCKGEKDSGSVDRSAADGRQCCPFIAGGDLGMSRHEGSFSQCTRGKSVRRIAVLALAISPAATWAF